MFTYCELDSSFPGGVPVTMLHVVKFWMEFIAKLKGSCKYLHG